MKSDSTALAQQQAAEWYALLSSGEYSQEESESWTQWLHASPEHAKAWALVEQVMARFQGLPPQLAQATLQTAPLDRRAVLKLCSVILTLGGLAALGTQTPALRYALADYSTGTAERRAWTLPGSMHLHLNARSSVSVRYSADQYLIRLLRGEMLIETGHLLPYMQHLVRVETRLGELTALSPRLMVSDRAGAIEVSLFEGRLTFQAPEFDLVQMRAGQAARLQSGTPLVTPLDSHAADWERGLVYADGMSLQRFLSLVAPYRHGLLLCDAQVANLQVSGVFRLDQSDRLLSELEDILPVRVRYFSRFWARVEAREQGV
jgi:transmembrane sensor